ncbi:MAG: cupin domain-containing protein [Solirubrobacteraceae bacterium]
MPDAAIEPLRIEMTGAPIGGAVPTGEGELWRRVNGEHLQLMELKLEKDYFHPPHSHPQNEAAGYVVSGKLEMMVGDEVRILGPGDSWRHPVGVTHSTKVLEDTLALEIHSPPRPEYVAGKV